MRMLLKIIALLLLLLLVAFSIIADMSLGRKVLDGLDLATYLRLASLISLIIAALLAWGYKRRIEASQKYRRADEALAQAEETVERKLKTLEATETRLEASFAEKEAGLDEQIGHATAEFQQRIKVLKQQNLELKETVGKLMRTLKRERSRNS